MQRVLLLMPKFMGYETAVIQVLKNRYIVDYVNCDCYDNSIISEYYRCNKLLWGIRHLCKSYDIKERQKAQLKFKDEYLKLIDSSNSYDYVLCINGGYMHEDVYRTIRENNRNAKFILYAWDDVDNLFNKSHIGLFDKVYSFNITDCNNNDWTYLPMFVQVDVPGHAECDDYDLLFVGSDHIERLKIADYLLNKYSDRYRLFIYIYSKDKKDKAYFYDKAMPYTDYVDLLRRSKVVLDVPVSTQTGPTTRFFDALTTKTKVITTNKHIIDYPVYSSNILIVDGNKFEIDDDFFTVPYQDTLYCPLTIDDWINEIGL